MKIAIDLTALAFNFSGIERYALNVALHLIDLGSRDDFYVLFCNEIHHEFQQLIKQNHRIHAHIVQASGNKLGKLLLFQWKVPRALRKVRADCYFFPAFEPPILFRKRNTIPVLHDLGYFDCPNVWKWYVAAYGKIKTRATLRHCSDMLTVSNDGRNRFIKRFAIPPEQVTVAYNAVDAKFRNEQLNSEKKQKVIMNKYGIQKVGYLLCLATLEPRKNIKLLVRAYAELYRQGKISTQLVLAGRKGWKIDDLLSEAGEATKNIIITGFIDDDDLPAVYQMAKLFVFPSLYEGFGLPPLEALACGTPVLVSDIPVFKEIYGDNASYFRNNNLEDLKKSLLDPTVYEKTIDKEWLEQFDWRRTAETVYSVIGKIVKRD